MRHFGALGLVCLAAFFIPKENAEAGAFSTPISDFIVDGSLFLPNGEFVEFKVRDGAFMKVKLDTDHAYAFMPVVQDAAKGRVLVKLFEIRDFGGDQQGVVEVASTPLTLNQEWQTRSRHRFILQIEDIRLGDFPESQVSGPLTPEMIDLLAEEAASSDCCIPCPWGGYICGCLVQSSCGFCCVGACCDGVDPRGPKHDHLFSQP